MARATTLGRLRASGYPNRSVKEELRSNLMLRLASGDTLFPSIIGYDDSVIPTMQRAVIAGHDIVMLGERGQAKSRLMRYLVELLDDEIPIIEGCEINDHPYRPVCARCKTLVSECGDETPVTWIGRNQRYSEKLATPDIAVADLIGDVDPIRVAEGRYLGDELTIHFGLVPRTHRGILAINELPDLPERIQVALLNVLEERDIQIRGYKIRLPLDIMLVCSANPEDYTHRGRIVSPLKDRFGTQVRTHYPRRADEEIRIMEQEATIALEGVPVRTPRFIKEVLAEFAAELRMSADVNQRSGISVRFSIGALETLAANAVRRAVVAHESEAVPRPADLSALLGDAIGRIEFDTLEEGREPEIMARALAHAVLTVWRRHLGREDFGALIAEFDAGLQVRAHDLMKSDEFLNQFPTAANTGARVGEWMRRLGAHPRSPAERASALEFCLEGLHLVKRINKSATGEPGDHIFSGGER